MIQSRTRGLGRRVVLITAMAALTVGLGAASASAAVVVAPNAGLNPAGQTVNVTGTSAPSGAASVALVACNAEAPRGERCDLSSAVSLQPVATYLTTGIAVNVRRGEWSDYDFTKGFPPAELESATTCLSAELGGEQCEVVASFYNQFKAPVGSPEGGSITFK